MKRTTLIAIAVLFPASLLAALFADPLVVYIGVVYAMMLAALSVVTGIVALVVARSRQRISRWPGHLMLVAAMVGCAGLGTVAFNSWLNDRSVREAKRYPTLVAGPLEDYRRAHGAYPQSLEELPAAPPVPSLLVRPYGYSTDGVTYSFSFPRPGGIFDMWTYHSATQTWGFSD